LVADAKQSNCDERRKYAESVPRIRAFAPSYLTSLRASAMSGPIKNLQTVIFLVTLKANIVAYFLISASNSEEVAEYKLVRDVDPKSNGKNR
jgi:hypothetical protein